VADIVYQGEQHKGRNNPLSEQSQADRMTEAYSYYDPSSGLRSRPYGFDYHYQGDKFLDSIAAAQVQKQPHIQLPASAAYIKEGQHRNK